MEDCKDPILLFKIPRGKRRELIEIYTQFVYVPSEKFAIPAQSITKAKSSRRSACMPIYVLSA
jgi:hypothetical protein